MSQALSQPPLWTEGRPRPPPRRSPIRRRTCAATRRGRRSSIRRSARRRTTPLEVGRCRPARPIWPATLRRRPTDGRRREYG